MWRAREITHHASGTVRTNTAAYATKCRSELCRNCVRSPRNRRQAPSFTGSHRDASCSGKSLKGLRQEVFRYHSVQLAEFVFQACLIDRSSISPFRINNLRSPDDQHSGNCDKSSNVPRSLTGFSSIAVDVIRGTTRVREIEHALRSESERERPHAGIARHQGQHVAPSRRTGDQANHAGPIEARQSV
jgi:hypothetical protein